MANTADRIRKRVRDLINLSGQSDGDFARDLGRTPAWISMFSNSKRAIPLKAVDEIADHFKIDSRHLVDPYPITAERLKAMRAGRDLTWHTDALQPDLSPSGGNDDPASVDPRSLAQQQREFYEALVRIVENELDAGKRSILEAIGRGLHQQDGAPPKGQAGVRPHGRKSRKRSA